MPVTCMPRIPGGLKSALSLSGMCPVRELASEMRSDSNDRKSPSAARYGRKRGPRSETEDVGARCLGV
jgi:hypothetical protein